MEVLRDLSASIAVENAIDFHRLEDLDVSSFSDAVLNKADATCLMQVLSHCRENNKAKVLGIIAELAKREENRTLLASDDIFTLVLNEIESTDKDVILQCFRAIGNVCMENVGGQSYVMMTGNIEKILSKFKSMAELSDGDLNILPKTAYGCVNNLSCENESLQLELVKYGAIPIFYSCLKSFITKDSEMAKIILEALSGLAMNETAKEQIIELNVISELYSFLDDCSDSVAISILDVLGEFIQDDEMSDIICSDSSLLALITAGARRPSFKEMNSQDTVLKKIFDSLVLFTSNESFEANLDDKELLNRLLELLTCDNRHAQISSALAIGNCAKNDMTCTDLVKCSVHVSLINLLKTVHSSEESMDLSQAILSALKNITIPVANKQVLSETELPELARNLVKTNFPVVQFKALAVLRLLVQGQTTLAVTLCNDETFLNVVAQCASRDTVIGLCAEARRLTASLIKHSQSSDAMNNVLRENGMQSLIGLLSSEHTIMQNEALVAIITLLASAKEANKEFLNAGGIEESTKLLKQASKKPHVVFNLISLFTAVAQDENCKKIVQEAITDELQKMANGPNELVMNRSIELLGILKS